MDRGDPLKKGKATYSSILAWRIPWTVEPGRLQSKGHKELDVTEVTNTFTFLVTQMVQSLSAMQETSVWSLGWEDFPEKGMANHHCILA